MDCVSAGTLHDAPPERPPATDRRLLPRQRLTRPIRLFDPVSGRFFPAQTRDASPAGLCLTTGLAVPLFPGRTIAVHLGREGHDRLLISRQVMRPATVVWVHRQPGLSRDTLCGVRWLPASESQTVTTGLREGSLRAG